MTASSAITTVLNIAQEISVRVTILNITERNF